MSKYMVFVQDTFAGINVTDKALQRKSTELMLKYDGSSECIIQMEKPKTIIKPIDRRLIQPNVDA